MLDVHAPHESVHSWRDFFVHLTTITIGLLIALGLEGCVEWQHHRHLVHEAEASLRTEIQSNASNLAAMLSDIHHQQEILKHDVIVLKQIIKTHKPPEKGSLEISFRIRTFDDVNWKTAQSTGALSYMPFGRAQEYSNIYDGQSQLDVVQKQAARDAIISLAPFANMSENENPTVEESIQIKQHIEVLQSQLMLLDSFIMELDREYKKFLSAHPE